MISNTTHFEKEAKGKKLMVYWFTAQQITDKQYSDWMQKKPILFYHFALAVNKK